jgi:hypothetical protein
MSIVLSTFIVAKEVGCFLFSSPYKKLILILQEDGEEGKETEKESNKANEKEKEKENENENNQAEEEELHQETLLPWSKVLPIQLLFYILFFLFFFIIH